MQPTTAIAPLKQPDRHSSTTFTTFVEQPSTLTSTRRSLKWYSSIDQAFHPTDHLIPPETRERFYLDLYLLTPDKEHLRDTLDRLSVQELLGVYKQNLNDLIGYGIRCLKNATEIEDDLSRQPNQPSADHPSDDSALSEPNEVDQIRLSNALETLSAIFKTIMTKEGYENLNLDLVSLIAGSIDNSDPVFSDFVCSIDKILSDQSQSLRTRHRTLQLALSVVSGVNQGSINAYFLRRDLFNTIASLVASPKTVSLVFDSVLLLDLLANFRRFESRNPYLVRMEDYVDEKAMERIISLSILALDDVRVAYQGLNASKNWNSSILGQVTSTVLNVFTSPLSRQVHSPHRTINQAFDSHPGRPTCILLPIYDLLCSNTTFLNVLLLSKPFWESFLSFSSYLLSYASSSPRSELYGQLALVILIHLAEEDQKFICGTTEESFQVAVDFCRDRQPPLGPSSDLERAPIAAMLDCGILYLRHNLQRKLKIETHLACLRLIHELLFCLQSQQVRLEGFDWRELWRVLFSLANHVGSRIDELKTVQDIDRLAQQILDILSFAAIWSEVLFTDNLTTAILYFEIMRSEETIKNLITVANISSGVNGSNNNNINNGSLGRKSSLINNGVGISSSNLGVSTIESVKNLNTIISKTKWILVQSKHAKYKTTGSQSSKPSFNFLFPSAASTSSAPAQNSSNPAAHPSAPTCLVISSAEDCLNFLQARLNEIGLIDSASLENHLRKYSETNKIEDLKKFIGMVPGDVLQLMVL